MTLTNLSLKRDTGPAVRLLRSGINDTDPIERSTRYNTTTLTNLSLTRDTDPIVRIMLLILALL